MALSSLNPARLVAFEFKAPAPSLARRAAAPAKAESTPPAEPATPGSDATAAPYHVEPMLLLHQEQAETMRLIAAYVGRAIQALRKAS
jgi:hypothetical protein